MRGSCNAESFMLTTLLSAATADGRSSTYFTAPGDMTVRVSFSGTIGTATISLEISPIDAPGTTFIPLGAEFKTGQLTPVILDLRAGDQLYAYQINTSGTSSTVRVQ